MNANKKVKILFLDDERLIRMSVAARLRKTMFEVVGVATPEEAVAELQKGGFQAILTDVMIGSVDGFMFRDIVRGINREIPMIFFTSIINDDGNRFLYRVMEDSFSTYLPKDAPTELLIKQLEQVTRASRAENEVKSLRENLDSTMHLASFVQTAMLPQWAMIRDSFFYGVCWHPYSQVSGDLYEWIPITKDSALVVFGDISGHGLSASLAMTAVQAYLKQFSHLTDEEAQDVSKIASQIDQFIYRNLATVAYMSGNVAYLNFSEKRIRFLNAGNPEFLCFKRDGEEIPLNPEKRGGVPMGMVNNTSYSDNDVVDIIIPEDAVIFCLSDGIYDLTLDEEGEERVSDDFLKEVMKESVKNIDVHGNLSTITLPYRVYSLLEDYGYNIHHDDVSLAAFSFSNLNKNEIYIEAPINYDNIDCAARKVAERLAADKKVSEELIMRVELLIGEFLVNLHDHGYEGITRHKKSAFIRVKYDKDFLIVSFSHRAHAWSPSYSTISPDEILEKANEKFQSHGRGVAIIQKIVSSYSSQTYAGLNINTFYIPYAKN